MVNKSRCVHRKRQKAKGVIPGESASLMAGSKSLSRAGGRGWPSSRASRSLALTLAHILAQLRVDMLENPETPEACFPETCDQK